jgi:hypothetical protein
MAVAVGIEQLLLLHYLFSSQWLVAPAEFLYKSQKSCGKIRRTCENLLPQSGGVVPLDLYREGRGKRFREGYKGW